MMNRCFLTIAMLLRLLAAGIVWGAGASTDCPQLKLPAYLYSDCGEGDMPYIPSGWMGDYDGIDRDECWSKHPHRGKTCIKITYTGNDWAGIVWQDPPNDWGEQPGGYNLSGARRLTFWARGERGGEVVEFKMGILKPGPKTTRAGQNATVGTDMVKYPDSDGAERKVTLSQQWKKYSIFLGGRDLRCIKSGFVWALKGFGGPTTFYLDDIRYE